MNDLINKFTSHLKNTLKDAITQARIAHRDVVEPSDLLNALVLQRGSVGAEVVWKSGYTRMSSEIPLEESHVETDLRVDSIAGSTWTTFSQKSQNVLMKAAQHAMKLRHRYIGTEHLLAGLLESGLPDVQRFLRDHKIRVTEIQKHLQVVLKSTSKFPDLTRMFRDGTTNLVPQTIGDGHDHGGERESALDFFATDITDEEFQQHVDPVIGRAEEIERIIHVLSRRTKNNPVLIGDPGVGKTAIVEGLAKRIALGDVPPILRNKRVLNLDLSLVVAGTMYRGEFEGRMKQIIEEVEEDPDVILFVDEMHTLVGAGSTSGSMDAANILKPALAKGTISMVGATTFDEYRKHIESDAALERRFQPVIVNELSPEDTKSVLRGIKQFYERFHRVLIDDTAVRAAVDFSVRYIQDKLLPDKAIDLIDEASSKLRVKEEIDPLTKTIENLERDVKKTREEKLKAVEEERYQDALKIKQRERMMAAKLKELYAEAETRQQKPLGTITERDIAEVVARITKIPVTEITATERAALRDLDQQIERVIVGQDEAVSTVASFIKRSRAGLNSATRPIASFLFLGPSGVGKTELAKQIALNVFRDEKALIRIDMSEFSEGFQASKLIGAPAGYVGYKDGGKLTESVKRRPYSVVLFDEIEKAHPEIFNLLLQVLDEGHLTDAAGKRINFKNTIIILTSNIGLSHLRESARLGFGAQESATTSAESRYAEIKKQVLEDLKKSFRPEFLNRIDQTIVFRPLSEESIKQIVRTQLQGVASKLSAQGVTFAFSPAVVTKLATLAYDPQSGAREVQRKIQEHIENPIADLLLSEDATPAIGSRVNNDQIVVERES